MPRAVTTILLAVVFYSGLLYWSVTWRKATEQITVISIPSVAPEVSTNAPALPDATSLTPTASSAPSPPSPPNPAPQLALEPARFAAEQNAEGRWEIAGLLPDGAKAQQLRSALGDDVAGEVDIDPATEPAPWAERLASWLPKQIEAVASSPGVAVMEGELLLAGELHSTTDRDALLAAAKAHFSGSGLKINTQLAVVEPPAEPELAIAPDGNGGLLIAGRLREPALKARLLELVRDVGEGMPFEDQVSTGNDIAAAPWTQSLVQVIPALITEVSGLQLMAAGGVFMMSGSVSAGSTKSALAEMAAQAFEGSPVSIDNQLTVSAEAATPSLAISRGEDGVLSLSGLLADQALADRIAKTAHAQVSDQAMASVTGLEIRQDVAPAPWADTFAGLIPPFAAAVTWGALSVHGDEVAIEAEVDDPESADVLTALVSNAFPEPNFKRVIEISVAAPAGPSDEDIATLEKLINESVIYFNNASTKVKKNQLGNLEELAAALGAVPGSGIALLGNTDPIGNADYNRKLSQQRCESVRSALEEFGVDFLLIEIEEGEISSASPGKTYESGRRVEFQLR